MDTLRNGVRNAWHAHRCADGGDQQRRDGAVVQRGSLVHAWPSRPVLCEHWGPVPRLRQARPGSVRQGQCLIISHWDVAHLRWPHSRTMCMQCLTLLAGHGVTERSRVLAVGDAMAHDIQGIKRTNHKLPRVCTWCFYLSIGH